MIHWCISPLHRYVGREEVWDAWSLHQQNFTMELLKLWVHQNTTV